MPRHFEASLNNLPMEVVDMITSYLDTDAKMALALTSARLRDFAFEWLQRVKPKVYSQTTRNYLKYNGSAVLELDFSNWVIPPCILSSLILQCQNITELNVVGTTLSCREIVGAAAGLRKLNALSFSLLDPMDQPRTYSDHNTTGPTNSLTLRVVDDPLSRKRFLNLKNLYVEIVGNVNSYDFVVDLMNRCNDLEVAHITMIVSQRSRQPENYFLTLSPDRWRTLRTFVLSNFDPSRQGCSQSAGLLTRIFGDRLVDGHILRWVLEKKDCYIYENAHFNGNRSSREARDLGGVLIEKLQRISLVSDDETFSKPWGSPQKLRIVSQNGVSTSQVRNILTHPRPWSLNVVELDLSEGHSFDYQSFSHFDLITLSPSLEAIALSPCFLGSSAQADKGSYQRVSGPTGRRPPELDLLDSRLGRLRLKKFCLKGSLMCIDCLTTALTASSIPDLTGLKWLQEIILNSVLLDGSAYDFVSNPNVRTLKLVLRWKSDFYGLTDLIKRCTKLRNLKLESSILPLQCKFMWRAFAECETLQQLCLGARNRIMMDVPQSAYDRENILRFVGQLVERLKVLHMHSSLSIYSKSAPPFNLHDVVRNMMISSALSEPTNETRNGRFVGPDQTSLAETDFLEDPPTFVGRGLCTPESFIGVVEPKGWTID